MTDTDLRDQLRQIHAECFGWAMRCCADDPHLAEEVLQGACLKVLDGRAVFGGRSSFKTWFFSVIRLTAVDARRWGIFRRLRRVGIELLQERAVDTCNLLAGLESREMTQALLGALARLPRRQQEVLQLSFYHDLSLSEAAGVMGISVGSARTHYERGKKSLRRYLNPEGKSDVVVKRSIVAGEPVQAASAGA